MKRLGRSCWSCSERAIVAISTHIALLFAALGALYLILALRAPASTPVGPNPARKAHIRFSLIFLAVSTFLLFWHRGLR